MRNNAPPQVFANLSRVITSWLPAIAKTMKQRYNRVSSYLDAIARAAARLVDCGDEGAGGWWWRRRRRITTEGCAVKGKRQTGGRHPVLIPIPTHPARSVTHQTVKGWSRPAFTLRAPHTDARRCTHTHPLDRGQGERETKGAVLSSVERSVHAYTCMCASVCV